MVERTLALMQEALEVDPDWEYFVNIGQVRRFEILHQQRD